MGGLSPEMIWVAVLTVMSAILVAWVRSLNERDNAHERAILQQQGEINRALTVLEERDKLRALEIANQAEMTRILREAVSELSRAIHAIEVGQARTTRARPSKGSPQE
jgi:beta-lactamase superfamily II metal-dependent hydrolase